MSLLPFVRGVVAPGSKVITDGWKGYGPLLESGYGHRRLVQQGNEQNPDALLPRVHRVASLLNRWLLGTHQGAVERTHLPYYLDEFTFRFNRRASRQRGMLFYRLVQQALAVDPAPYGLLVGGSENTATQDVGGT